MKAVDQLASQVGITKSHSRPHVSNDNPFSESQFKTLKYCPQFPDRFASYHQSLDFCSTFFHWQNFEHHHGGLGLLTPATVHHAQADAALAARQAVLDAAYTPPIPSDSSASRPSRSSCPPKSGSTPRPTGRNPVR